MIPCLDLEIKRRGEYTDAPPSSTVLLRALGDACAVWRDVQDCSEEAGKVYKVLNSILLSFEPETDQSESPEQPVSLPEPNQPLSSLDAYEFETSKEMDIDWVGSVFSFDLFAN